MDSSPRIAAVRLAADPAAWHEVGFAVSDGATRIGATRVCFEGPRAGRGVLGWRLSGEAGTGEWDGLDTEEVAGLDVLAGGDRDGQDHPIGALRIDHLVVFTPELERTIEAFERNGVRCRRVREVGPPDQQLRQGFFRFGEVIVEVVQVPEDRAGPGGAARFWGLTVTVEDLEGAAAELGPGRIGTIREAVQPGRRIATLRKGAGLGLPVALITPEPPRDPRE